MNLKQIYDQIETRCAEQGYALVDPNNTDLQQLVTKGLVAVNQDWPEEGAYRAATIRSPWNNVEYALATDVVPVPSNNRGRKSQYPFEDMVKLAVGGVMPSFHKQVDPSALSSAVGAANRRYGATHKFICRKVGADDALGAGSRVFCMEIEK